MKKKRMIILNIIFSLAFLVIIFVPFCMLDTTEIIDSELENRRMTMWPGWHFNQEINEWYGHYVEDRVGFREEAVQIYMSVVHDLFGEFTDDMHMYGKEGEIFPGDSEYIRAYQNLATDEELIDSLVTYLARTDAYLEEKGIPFVFVAGLDKKTVYGEYMPDYIRVDESKESIMEMLSRKLDENGVDYVIPLKEYEELKKTQKIYNKRYDTAHWNPLGAMACLKLLNEKIREEKPEVPVLDESAFELTYTREQVEGVSVPLTETVPVYSLKPEYAETIERKTDLAETLEYIPGTSMQHFVNEEALSDETILIFQDSFLQDNWYYFAYRYKEVYMISRQNYERMQYYVETLSPDVVVYENAERAFVDDLYAYVKLADIIYE